MSSARKWSLCLAVAGMFAYGSAYAGGLDMHLSRAAASANAGNAAQMSKTGLLRLKTRNVGGQQTVYASAILELETTAIPALQAMGVVIHTVVSNGIATADIPVNRLRAVAARADVGKVEAGKAVRKFNDVASGLYNDGAGTDWGMNNPGTYCQSPQPWTHPLPRTWSHPDRPEITGRCHDHGPTYAGSVGFWRSR